MYNERCPTLEILMTPRERMLAAFAFDNPDRLPVWYHPSPAGLYVHGRKLLDLFHEYPPDNPVTFDAIPQPSPAAFDADGRYHEFKRDELGTTWEYRIFGVAGHPHEYAVPSAEMIDAYAFPPAPEPRGEAFEAQKAQVARQKERYLAFGGWINLFETMHGLRPFEDVLMDIATQEPATIRLLDRLVEHRRKQMEYQLALGVDVIMFGDDWGTQDSLLISPKVFRDVFKPRLASLMAPVRRQNGRIFYHSCGTVHPLYNDLVEIGINGLWHQIGLYDAEQFADEAARNRTVLFLHMDRQRLVPLGTPHQIRETVKRYAEIHRKRGGGAIFYVEIENDAPFENVEALIQAVHEQGNAG
jgi:uroporphyrinogen decarboxylase